MLVHEAGTRSDADNRRLAWTLAFVAGAVNAGGFLAIGRYTSHMTGVVSAMADDLALSRLAPFAAALAMLGSFLAGAMLSSLIISWGRRHRWHSRYAGALSLEALLLLLFGALGARHGRSGGFDLGLALLLCAIMGLQNAIVTSISGAVVRTTHLTGVVTDLGIELSKLIYWNRAAAAGGEKIVANRQKLRLHGLILCAFFAGAVLGALGFRFLGYGTVIPLALWLLFPAARPLWKELQARRRVARQNAICSPGRAAP